VTDNGKGTRPGSGTTTYSYDAVGNLAGYVYPNSVETSYEYNTLNRLTSMRGSKGTGTLASYGYTLGATGNRLSVVEANGRKVNYTYDDLYRLKSETISDDPATANNGSVNYDYDAVGNRLSRTSTIAAVPSTTSGYDANDRLASDTYDANGSTTGSGGNVYRYDFENKIIALNPGTANQVTFVYDGDGNRVSKTVGTGASAVTTKFLVDTNSPTGSAQVVDEIVSTGTGSGSVQRTYVHGHSLISQTQLLGSPTPSWTSSFYGMDGHGSVRFLTNSTGTITDSYDYDAFGNLIRSPGTTPNNYLYAGEQFDPHVGFYYLRARYMNASTGRFWTMDSYSGTSHDPISLHKYLYANGNAPNLIDPSGNVTIPDITVTLQIRTTIQGNSYVVTISATIQTARVLALGLEVGETILRDLLIQNLVKLGIEEFLDSAGGPGYWARPDPPERLSETSKRYQEQITHRSSDEVYAVDDPATGRPVKFDGYWDGALLEAKGPGYDRFLNAGGKYEQWFRGRDGLLEQAHNQSRAARGGRLVWHFAELAAAQATRALLQSNGISGIDIFHTPLLP
jgi:RHS repeat-associated protein